MKRIKGSKKAVVDFTPKSLSKITAVQKALENESKPASKSAAANFIIEKFSDLMKVQRAIASKSARQAQRGRKGGDIADKI